MSEPRVLKELRVDSPPGLLQLVRWSNEAAWLTFFPDEFDAQIERSGGLQLPMPAWWSKEGHDEPGADPDDATMMRVLADAASTYHHALKGD